METIYKNITQTLKEYFTTHNIKRAVVGLSGGIDSALTLKLAVDFLGKENVHAILMPDQGLTKKENIHDAQDLALSLGVGLSIVPINSFLKPFASLPWQQNELALINTKARIRAMILYNYANTHKALVLGTSNKSEIYLGYGTKYGDLAADIYVLGDLYKTEVIGLSKTLNLPKNIIRKAPSAELFEGQTDEEELGASYEILDKIIKALGHNKDISGFPANLIEKIKKRHKESEHKRVPVPVIKV